MNVKVVDFVCDGCCGKVKIVMIAEATEEQLAQFRIVCPCQKFYPERRESCS